MDLPEGTTIVDALPVGVQEELEAALTIEDVQDSSFDKEQMLALTKRVLERYPWLKDMLEKETTRVAAEYGPEILPVAIGFCAGAGLRIVGKYIERGR